MSFFAWKGSARSESGEHTGRNLQDGLFQIASQACHILVQVSSFLSSFSCFSCIYPVRLNQPNHKISKGEQYAQRFVRWKQQRKEYRIFEMFRQRRGLDRSGDLFREQSTRLLREILHEIRKGTGQRSGCCRSIAAS